MSEGNEKRTCHACKAEFQAGHPPICPNPSGDRTRCSIGRGFARIDPARLREISSLGGKAVHERGTAHHFTREEAQRAGRLGGLAPHRKRGGVRVKLSADLVAALLRDES